MKNIFEGVCIHFSFWNVIVLKCKKDLYIIIFKIPIPMKQQSNFLCVNSISIYDNYTLQQAKFYHVTVCILALFVIILFLSTCFAS